MLGHGLDRRLQALSIHQQISLCRVRLRQSDSVVLPTFQQQMKQFRLAENHKAKFLPETQSCLTPTLCVWVSVVHKWCCSLLFSKRCIERRLVRREIQFAVGSFHLAWRSFSKSRRNGNQ